jgi:probable phosphoglycerate mutase
LEEEEIMRLYIIRHAEPDYENDTITEEGQKQAEALAKRLEKEGITKIYCSPLGRAVATMEYTAKLLNIKPTILEWTQELPPMDVEDEKIGKWPAWNLPGEVIFDQESFLTQNKWHELPLIQGVNIKEKYEEIRQESDLFLKELGYERVGSKYCLINPNEEKIAVFCHGAFGRTWISQLLQIPLPVFWASFWISPTSVTTILFEERSKKWAVPRCIGFGDAAHLYEAGIPVSSNGLTANIY